MLASSRVCFFAVLNYWLAVNELKLGYHNIHKI